MAKTFLISENSILRHLQKYLSRRQTLLFDGVRYSAEMANIAYMRLEKQLQAIAFSRDEPTSADIARAMLDAWSIVDSAHRFHDLVHNTPGLPGGTWKRLLKERVKEALDLRDFVQHQVSHEMANVDGQIWGYLSWAEVREGRPTGKWLMISPGAIFKGDKWFFIGPKKSIPMVPISRIRLKVFDTQVYLGKLLNSIKSAVEEIETLFKNGNIKGVGPPVGESMRSSDMVMEGAVEILYSNPANI